MPKRSEALPVGVPPATEVQLRLIAYADEEGAGRTCAYRAACNGNRPIAVSKSRVARRFVSDGGQILAVVGQSALHDVDLDRPRIVVGPNGPIECAAGIQPAINILEEVAGGDGRAAYVQQDCDRTHRGIDQHPAITIPADIRRPGTARHHPNAERYEAG
jgi:hypothetical protein